MHDVLAPTRAMTPNRKNSTGYGLPTDKPNENGVRIGASTGEGPLAALPTMTNASAAKPSKRWRVMPIAV
jgi:hypothetical protein